MELLVYTFVGLFLLLFPIVVLLAALVRNSRRLRELETHISPLSLACNRLERQQKELQNELRALRELLQPSTAQPSPEAVPAEKPAVAAEAAPPPKPTPVVIPEKAVEASPLPPPLPVRQPVVISMEAAPRKAPPTEPQPPRPPAPPVPTRKTPSFDWEGLVGVKLFSWIAGVALLLAAVFFLRYSIDRGWLMPPVRMAIGILVGIGLLVLCELKTARRYPVTANAMDASAIAILFSTFFAARALWNLIDVVPAFVLMVLVTAVAVLLSIRRDSMFIALLGLVGGFATPALLSTGENRPISLFSYLLLLNAGLAWVATKKKWPLLTTLSLVVTTLYQWTWVMKFLTASQFPIAVGIFLVFPILAFVALAIGQAEKPQKGWISLQGQTANLSALLPLLFIIYAASVPAYGRRYILLFSFLFLLDAGLFAVAAARGPEILHRIGALSTILVYAIWFLFSYESLAWPAVLLFVALFVLFYLAAPFIARRFGSNLRDTGGRVVFAAPLLLFTFPVLAAVEPNCAEPGLLFGSLFLLMAAASAYAIFAEAGAIYFLAAFIAIVAEAVWSSKYLTPEHLLPGLALYGIFGLFYLGVPLLARRWNKTLRPEAAGMVVLLVSLALLFFLAAGPVASAAVWGLALLLLIMNTGLFLHGSVCRLPLLATAGIVLSWMILGVLWASVSLASMLIPALVVVAGFALLAMAGNLWLQKHASGAEAGLVGNGIFLGLAGHLFLFVVAVEPTLSIPPWPLLVVLLVLDLSIGAAALYTRRNDLHLASMVASAFILANWVPAAGVAPWPGVAILSAGALVLFSIFLIYLAGSIGIEVVPFARTAAITVLLAQLVAILAGMQPGCPGVGFLIAAHLAFLIALLGIASFSGKHVLAVIAVVPTAIAVSLWMSAHAGPDFWQQQLLFSSAIYLVFLCYPLLLGRRAGRSLGPYLAAVLSSAPFFFQARHSMIQAGWEGYIGILPVSQALLMALLVMKLLSVDRRGEQAPGRLALVAGAGLAFVTVAIPLQLEKEWITVGWALQGAALAWLFRKIPHRGLLYATSGLFTAVFVRLALNPSVLTYEPRGAIRIWNWYLYTYLVSAAAMILAGWLLAKTKDSLSSRLPRVSKLLSAGGAILLFLLLNIEIADYYSAGATITFNFSATLAQDLTYTLGWALFAVALLAVGIVIHSQPARIAALGLLVATILKCFLHDLARLGGLYRIMSFVGLAICLALVAIALQKFVLSLREERN